MTLRQRNLPDNPLNLLTRFFTFLSALKRNKTPSRNLTETPKRPLLTGKPRNAKTSKNDLGAANRRPAGGPPCAPVGPRLISVGLSSSPIVSRPHPVVRVQSAIWSFPSRRSSSVAQFAGRLIAQLTPAVCCRPRSLGHFRSTVSSSIFCRPLPARRLLSAYPRSEFWFRSVAQLAPDAHFVSGTSFYPVFV